MKVYLDVIFLENFIIDMVLMNITNKLMKLDATNKRIICSAIVGGLYSVIFYIPYLSFMVKLPIVILMACFIVFIAINKVSIKIIIKATSVFIGLSIILTGMCLFLMMVVCNRGNTDISLIGRNTVKNIILSLLIMFCIVSRISNYIKERTLVNNFVFQVKLFIDNRQYYFKAFLDTGNELREPVTNLPCILVEKRLIGDIEVEKDKVYFIPYSAVGVKGKLEGIKVQKVMIRQDDDNWREIEAIICFCNEKFSEDGDFNALLSRGII